MKERPYSIDWINSVFVLHRIADEHGIQPWYAGAACPVPLGSVTTFSTGVEWDFVAAQNVLRVYWGTKR